MTATIDPDGKAGGPAIDNVTPGFTWETYPERLQRAGISVAGVPRGRRLRRQLPQVLQAVPEPADHRPAVRRRAAQPDGRRLRGGREVRQPAPGVVDRRSDGTIGAPALRPRRSARCSTQRYLAAIWANPRLWARTLFIFSYDENGGFFDHVPPPVPDPGTAGEFVRGVPIGLGFRVPAVVVSPWSRGGKVCSTTFDHTSTLTFLERRFGVEVPNLSRWRRRTRRFHVDARSLPHRPVGAHPARHRGAAGRRHRQLPSAGRRSAGRAVTTPRRLSVVGDADQSAGRFAGGNRTGSVM